MPMEPRMSSRPALTSRLGRLGWLALVLLVSPRQALAYRPFDSTDASVADPGTCEIEVNPLTFAHAGHDDLLTVPGLVVNLGLLPRWELVVEGSHVLLLDSTAGADGSRLLDTGLNVKGLLRSGSLQGRDGPSVAVELGALLPEIGGESGAGASATLAVSHRWPALTVHANGEVSITRSHDLGLAGGLILEGPQTWRARPVAEARVEWEKRGELSASGLLGAVWRVTSSLSVDVGFVVGGAERVDLFETRAGLTWVLPLWGEPS